MSLTIRRSLGLLGTLTILVAACGSSATTAPTTAPSGAPSTAPTTAPTEAPTAAAAEQTLNYALDADLSGGAGNAADNVPTGYVDTWIHGALYTYDDKLAVVPWLATDQPTVEQDGAVWTVKIHDATFTDGSPVTADDVIQSYAIGLSPNCPYNPSVCLSSVLKSMEKVDDKTVKFTLLSPNVTFLTTYMPGVLIESKASIDASYARFKEKTSAVTAAEAKAVADKLDAIDKAVPTGGTADYSAVTADMEAILTKAGIALPDKAKYVDDKGAPDPVGYAAELALRARVLNKQFTEPPIDALAAAYKYLDVMFKPVGLGPFKLDEWKPGESVTLSRYDDFFLGKSTISKIFMPIIRDDIAGGQALKAGQIDWKYSLTGQTYNEIKDAPNVAFVNYPDFGYFGLYFNMRDGQLFADKNLRQAVAYCVDKPATVAAATAGNGVAIYNEIPPASWAYPTDLPTYEPRDTAKAKSLIEASGWTLGSDGVYEKGGKKLSTIVAVRAGKQDRVKFMQLLSDQVKECGMDIKYKEVEFASLLQMIDSYPPINAADPASGKQFDAYFGGFGSIPEPDPYSLSYSGECSTKEKPSTYNYICYQNPEVDKLILQGRATFQQAARIPIYQEYAKIEADDMPVYYAWADNAHQGLSSTVGSSTGPLNMTSYYFYWDTPHMTNAK